MPKRRPSGDGMLRKRKDGMWEGRIVVGHKEDGSSIFKSVFSRTQKEVTEKLHRLIDFYHGAELTEDSKMPLSQWLYRWLNEYKSGSIRESTRKSYESYIRVYISPRLGDKPISLITNTDVQKLYNEVRMHGRIKDGSSLSASTVRRCHMMLHEAMEAAVRERLIVCNPTNATTIPKKSYAPIRVLNNKQLEVFMEAIKSDAIWNDFFYTEMTTGLRRGEICGLKWSDFDECSGNLQVVRTLTRDEKGKLKEGSTKTETGRRTILLPQSTAEVLRNRKQNAIGEWVFCNPIKPEEPLNPSSAYRRMKKFLLDTGLPNIRFHDLRHTFATHAMANGVDPKTLSGILGHTNASFTLDTYTHVTSDMQKNAAGIVSNILSNVIGEDILNGET